MLWELTTNTMCWVVFPISYWWSVHFFLILSLCRLPSAVFLQIIGWILNIILYSSTLLFCHDQIPNKLTERVGVCTFGSSAIQGKAWWQQCEVTDHIAHTIRKPREMNGAQLSSLHLFYLAQDPSLCGGTMLRVGPSPAVKLLEIPSQTHPEPCFHGDSTKLMLRNNCHNSRLNFHLILSYKLYISAESLCWFLSFFKSLNKYTVVLC